MACVIIPVMDEAGNIGPLVREIAALGCELEVHFVDDSQSLDTVDAIRDAARASSSPRLTVTYLHRTGSDRSGGIIGAVKAGMVRAKARGHARVVVMDGDGQHPPALIPQLVRRLATRDIVVSSRYMPGGDNEGLNGSLRVFASLLATRVAKALFPRELKGLSDPMTGFFAADVGKIDIGAIEASGFKVLLEIMLTNPGLTRSEVPVVFRKRLAGKSKATVSVAGHYLSQLVRRRFALSLSSNPSKRRLGYENA